MKLTKISANVATIDFNSGIQVLFSYNTPVAAHIPGVGFVKTGKKWSSTTSKHITQYTGDKNTPTKEQSFFDELVN